MFNGSQEEFRNAPHSLTARYLTGRETIPLPLGRRTGRRHLVLTGAREHNLKGVTLRLPLGTLTVVSGVSGSGKSTLVHDTLYRAVARAFKTGFATPGAHDEVRGLEYLKGIRLIDQEPIGRTPRSNPITYVKAFDEIRKVYAALPRAKTLGLEAGAFSFNVPGGRCEKCDGDGFEKLEMYFFEDVYVSCAECEGRRYRPDVLTVKLRGRSIADVLAMTVDEAVEFFAARTRARPPPARAPGRRPGLPPAGSARDHALGRRGPAAEDRRRASARGRRPRCSTSSTSPRRACTSTTSRSFSVCSTAWWTRATPCSWSSTTWT